MAFKITTWSPDTCGCVLQYSWDSSVPAEERVHTPHAILTKCAKHSETADIHIHHAQVLEENQRKNKAAGAIAAVPGITHDDIRFSYAGPVLVLRCDRLTVSEKDVLQKAFDAEHGPGMVSFDTARPA